MRNTSPPSTEANAAWFPRASILALVTAALLPLPTGASEGVLHSFPFHVERNRVLLPVRIAGSETLDVLLDTGMGFDGVLLFHEEHVAGLDEENLIEVVVPGAGGGEPTKAIMADSAAFTCGDILFTNQRIIVSTSGITQGFGSNGVLGWTLLGHYAVEIDYDEMRITLYEPGAFRPDSSWEAIDLTLRNGIPWIAAAVAIDEGEPVPVDLYIDLAGGEVIEILVSEEMKLPLPKGLEKRYLGTGLSGDIHGGVGRISELRIGSFSLHDVTAAFPEADSRSKQESADAVLGSGAVRRFHAVFDYDAEKLYLKPNKQFHSPFTD